MSSPSVESIRESVQTTFWLAHLLEYMEQRGGAVDAQGYRDVVTRLQERLLGPLPDAALAAVLRTYPSAVEVFENLHYAHAGLSCASLECTVLSEVLAARLIGRVSERRPHRH
ncbi:MAG: hypothetical protein CFE40_10605 [Burkholderiales bacterium PBB1]|nr:MAG: hypothetical protein CFE40_10605 [Burkholderiales bacterium PBB1]